MEILVIYNGTGVEWPSGALNLRYKPWLSLGSHVEQGCKTDQGAKQTSELSFVVFELDSFNKNLDLGDSTVN